jgi:hypothetical protein
MPTEPQILEAIEHVNKNIHQLLTNPAALGKYSLVMTDANYSQQIDPACETKAPDDKVTFFANFIIKKIKTAFEKGSYSQFVNELSTEPLYFTDDTEPQNPNKDFIKNRLAPLLFLALQFPQVELTKNLQSFNKIIEEMAKQNLDAAFDRELKSALEAKPSPPVITQYSIAHFDQIKNRLQQWKPVADQKDDDPNALATITNKSSSSRVSTPSTPPVTLPATDKQKIDKLVTHYISLSNLAIASNHEFKNKALLIANNQILLALLNKVSPSNPLFTTLTTANTLLSSNTSPNPPNIWHFGEKATLETAAGKEKMFAKLEPTDPINPGDTRTTEFNLSGTTVKLIEKWHAPAAGSTTPGYTSTTLLPDTLDDDQLKAWARATINSCLAAAPQGCKPHFEDGLRDNQLAALMSYCDFKGIDYSIGDKQWLRLFATQIKTTNAKDLTDEQWDKLSKNEVIVLSSTVCQTLAATIDKQARETWYQQRNTATSTISGAAWQTWENNHPDERIPSLGKAEGEALVNDVSRLTSQQSLGTIQQSASFGHGSFFSKPPPATSTTNPLASISSSRRPS